MKNVRTADNMFISNGIVQKQLLIEKSLYVCFADFSKAFDLVNPNCSINSCGQAGVDKLLTISEAFTQKMNLDLKCSGILPYIIAEFLQSVVPHAEFSINKAGV